MKIFRYLLDFSKKVAASRAAQTFFVVHLTLLTTALVQRGSLFQPFHAEYEPIIMNILAVINAPASVIAVILAFPITLLLSIFDLGKNQSVSHFFVIFMYVIWQIQATLLGYGFAKILTERKLDVT